MDRSNMATEWTISPPGEPNNYPFNEPYNGAGVFRARRLAAFDGVARLHPQWTLVRQVHTRGRKILAVVSHTGSDFDKKDYIEPAQSGCQWGTLQCFVFKSEVHFDRVNSLSHARISCHSKHDLAQHHTPPWQGMPEDAGAMWKPDVSTE